MKRFLATLSLAFTCQQAMAAPMREDIGPTGINCIPLLMQAFAGTKVNTASDLRIFYALFTGRIDLSTDEARVAHYTYLLPTILDHRLEGGLVSPEMASLLKKLRYSMGHEQALLNLRFASRQKSPELFASAGEDRVAATAFHVGGDVLFNTDEIGLLSDADLVTLLVHEYAHHHGLKDDTVRSLDTLGTAVARTLRMETHNLSQIGAPKISFSKFNLNMAQSRAETPQDVVGLGPMHLHDLAAGTQLTISDGRVTHNLRELLRSTFSSFHQSLFTGIYPEEWRLDENDNLVLHLKYTELSFSFMGASQSKKYLDVVMPLERDSDGELRFKPDLDFRVDIVERRTTPSLTEWLHTEHFGFNPYDYRAIGEDISLAYDNHTFDMEITFEAPTGIKKPNSMINMFWVVDDKLNPEQSTRRLFNLEHDLGRATVVDFEEIEPGRYKMKLQRKHYGDLSAQNLKLAGMMLFTGIRAPNGDYIDRVFIEPESTPTLHTKKDEEPLLVQLPRPQNHRPEVKIPLYASPTYDNQIRSKAIEWEVVVPDDFPTNSHSFSRRGGASVRPVFKNHKFKANDFRFDIEVVAGPDETLPRKNLVLKFNVETWVSRHPLNTHGHRAPMPDQLEVEGFVIQSADLHSWYLPAPTTITFSMEEHAP